MKALGGYVEGMGPSLEEIVQEHEPRSGEPEPSWRLFARILLVASFYE